MQDRKLVMGGVFYRFGGCVYKMRDPSKVGITECHEMIKEVTPSLVIGVCDRSVALDVFISVTHVSCSFRITAQEVVHEVNISVCSLQGRYDQSCSI